MRTLYGILALVLLGGLPGCVRTTMTTFVDPDFRTTDFGSIIVFGDLPLDHRKTAEEVVVAECTAAGKRCVKGMDYLPPTRKMDDESLKKAVMESKADAVLHIGLTQSGTDEAYVPPTFHPGVTTYSRHVVGDRTYVYPNTSPGYVTGGYSVSRPHARYTAVLETAKDGTTAWTATFSSRGTGNDDPLNLTRDAARKAIKGLIADGLL